MQDVYLSPINFFNAINCTDHPKVCWNYPNFMFFYPIIIPCFKTITSTSFTYQLFPLLWLKIITVSSPIWKVDVKVKHAEEICVISRYFRYSLCNLCFFHSLQAFVWWKYSFFVEDIHVAVSNWSESYSHLLVQKDRV